MLAPQPLQQISNIVGLLPPVAEDGSDNLQGLRDTLLDEVKADYDFSLKKSIGTEQHWSNYLRLRLSSHAHLIYRRFKPRRGSHRGHVKVAFYHIYTV